MGFTMNAQNMAWKFRLVRGYAISGRSFMFLGTLAFTCMTSTNLAQHAVQSPALPPLQDSQSTATSQPTGTAPAAEATMLPSGWQDLPFEDFVDVVSGFYRVHGRCDHCAPIRQKIADISWNRFLGVKGEVIQRFGSDHAKVIKLIQCVGGSLSQ